MLHLAICDKSLNDIEQMEKYLENIKFFNFIMKFLKTQKNYISIKHNTMKTLTYIY